MPLTPACSSTPTASSPGTGGFVEANGKRLNIRNIQAIQTPQQLGDVPHLQTEMERRCVSPT